MLGRNESCSYTRELSPARVSIKWASGREGILQTERGHPARASSTFTPYRPHFLCLMGS